MPIQIDQARPQARVDGMRHHSSVVAGKLHNLRRGQKPQGDGGQPWIRSQGRTQARAWQIGSASFARSTSGTDTRPRRVHNEAFRLSRWGAVELLWKRFCGHFGFWEAFNSPEEQASGKMLPPSEWMVDRMRKSGGHRRSD
jgi:hypothetical protein